MVSYAVKLDILFSVLHVRSHTLVSLCTADSTAPKLTLQAVVAEAPKRAQHHSPPRVALVCEA